MKLWEKIALNWVNFFSLFPPFYSGNFIFLPVFPGKFERGEMRKFFFSFFFQIYLSLETGSRFGPITIISCTLSTKNVCLMKDSLSGNSRRSIKMCKTSASIIIEIFPTLLFTLPSYISYNSILNYNLVLTILYVYFYLEGY